MHTKCIIFHDPDGTTNNSYPNLPKAYLKNFLISIHRHYCITEDQVYGSLSLLGNVFHGDRVILLSKLVKPASSEETFSTSHKISVSQFSV